MKDLTQLQKRKIKSNIPLYVLLFPSIILLIMFAYIPMLGLVIAFKDYSPANGILNSPWAGFKYFIQFFKSVQFGTTMTNTLKISIYSILVGFPLPILLALLCNQLRTGKFKRMSFR